MNNNMKALIRKMVEADYKYKNNHLASCLSALPIIDKIYSNFDYDNDIFILSKGHACYALYAVLEKHGYSVDWAKIHPDRNPAKGITITSGSLGHGLGIGAGIALSKRILDQSGKVYVLLGDGECQEGSVWEALLNISSLELYKEFMEIYIDNNKYQGTSKELHSAVDKLKLAFPFLNIVNTNRWEGIEFMKFYPGETVHLITAQEYDIIMKELSNER